MVYVKDLPRMRHSPRDARREAEQRHLDRYVGGIRRRWCQLRAACDAHPEIASDGIAAPARPRGQNPVKLIFEVDDVDTKFLRGWSCSADDHSAASMGCIADTMNPEGNVFGLRAPGDRSGRQLMGALQFCRPLQTNDVVRVPTIRARRRALHLPDGVRARVTGCAKATTRRGPS